MTDVREGGATEAGRSGQGGSRGDDAARAPEKAEAEATGDPKQDRGRSAASPTQIPARGWWDILKRTQKEISSDNVSLLAAGVAFYAILAIFPALIAIITVYGLVANPENVATQIESFTGGLPEETRTLLEDQLTQITATSGGGLGFGLVLSLLGVLYSASGGVAALITGLNLAYDEKETRGFLKLRGLALLLTVGAIVTVVVALGLVAVLPGVIDLIGLGSIGQTVVNIGRWPVLALLILVAIGVLYRYGPDRDNPRWRWVSWGSLIAVVLWLIASAAFSFYASNFGSYNKTYGALAGVIILLFWLYLTAFIILAGAELNAEMEHQTVRDTTEGPEVPMGERRATVADTVGEAPPSGKK